MHCKGYEFRRPNGTLLRESKTQRRRKKEEQLSTAEPETISVDGIESEQESKSRNMGSKMKGWV